MIKTQVNPRALLQLIEIAAVFVSALSGIFEARKKRMDLVGVYSVALITAFGGGTLRDLLLDRRPLYWVENDHYAIWIFVVCIGAVYLTRGITLTERMIAIPDALGLGLFSITGAYYATEQHTSLFIASLFGVITGVFGGVLRDVVCNEIPAVFSPSTSLYATCSFAGSWVYLLGVQAGWQQSTATTAGIAVTFLLRMLAIRYNLRLPAPKGEPG
jgi:uncharacterized membrane protein YeiH